MPLHSLAAFVDDIQTFVWTVVALVLVHYCVIQARRIKQKQQPAKEEKFCEMEPWEEACTIRDGETTTRCSVIRVHSDGRCLFRCIAFAISARSRTDTVFQQELADKLRSDAMDALVQQQADLEYIVEGDFDEYTREMRNPDKHAGEPEVFMLCQLLRRPIIVYIQDDKSRALKINAEYGKEYTQVNPAIRIVYQEWLLQYDLILAGLE